MLDILLIALAVYFIGGVLTLAGVVMATPSYEVGQIKTSRVFLMWPVLVSVLAAVDAVCGILYALDGIQRLYRWAKRKFARA